MILESDPEIVIPAEKRQKTLTGYQEMRYSLGELGVCDRTAKEILAMKK